MINGNQLRDALISAAHVLAAQKQAVDALNIFPVPDGDTGTNMSMTLSGAGRELSRMGDTTADGAASTAASAMLRGARGNSGVILSLLFRGIGKGMKGKETADGTALAEALQMGVDAAYKAVMKPTEGTILTVAREAAAAGKAAALADPSALSVWAVICDEAEASLARTPDLLPVLKKAGVVDAGGQGLCIIFRAMQAVFEGGEIVAGDVADTAVASAQTRTAAGSFETDIKFTYCTEFIVAREDKAKDPLKLRAFLESVGDCVVVVDDDEIIKVHVHTNDPGRVLHEAIEYGQFETVKVENMRIQHANANWVGDEGGEPTPPAPVEATEEFSFVAVAAGEGLQSLMSDLGCEQVVSGGQTMNPSTEDILQAIEATAGKTVFVLPNNKNIILAAEQTIPLTGRTVHVLPTRSVPQGMSALLAFDPTADAEENLLTMSKAMDAVSVGQITFAARDSDYENRSIKQGQILAMDNGKLSFVDNDLLHAVGKLAKTLVNKRRQNGEESAFITLMYGEEITEAQAEEAMAAIQSRVGDDIEVTLIDGGQPVYYYILSVE